MTEQNDEPQLDDEGEQTAADQEQPGAESSEPTVEEEAEELITDPGPFLRKLQLNPDLTSRAGEGFRALRESVGDFFVASDRGAGRTKDSADKVIDLIQAELDREGLSPQERLEFVRAGERMADQVGDSEKDVRESNERILAKVVGIAAGAVVGVILLGYLAKDGKLPPPAA